MNQQRPLTTKDMINKSLGFKVCIIGCIFFAISAIICAVVGAASDCRTYYSCYAYYISYTYDCTTSYGQSYCCTYNYKFCGDSNCLTKPWFYEVCWGWYLAQWLCSSLAMIFAISAIIMICQFRRRARFNNNNAANNYGSVNGANNIYYAPGVQNQQPNGPIYYPHDAPGAQNPYNQPQNGPYHPPNQVPNNNPQNPYNNN